MFGCKSQQTNSSHPILIVSSRSNENMSLVQLAPQAVKSQEDEFKLARRFMAPVYSYNDAKKDKKKTRKNEEEEDEDEEEEVLEVGNSSWWKDDTDEKKKTFRESKSSRNRSTSDNVEGALWFGC